jgi:hypothetical protein
MAQMNRDHRPFFHQCDPSSQESSPPKTMREKLRRKDTICHVKLFYKSCGKIRRKRHILSMVIFILPRYKSCVKIRRE